MIDDTILGLEWEEGIYVTFSNLGCNVVEVISENSYSIF